MAELHTLARPYARAAFEYANANGSLNDWSEQLSTAASITRFESVSQLLGSPEKTSAEKAKLLVDVAGDELGEAQQRFMHVLADNQRLALLPEIVTQFEHLKAQHDQRVDITIVTPFELEQAQVDKLKQALAVRMSQATEVSTEVDSTLLGGVLIKAGDTVIDGSVRGRLNRLAEAMN